MGEDNFFGLGTGHGFKLPTGLFFEALAIGSLPQFSLLSSLVGYFCRAGLGSCKLQPNKCLRVFGNVG